MLFQQLFGVFFICIGAWNFYKYYRAINNWTKVKGEIVDYDYWKLTPFPIVKFITKEGKEVLAKTDFHLPFTRVFYRTGTEVIVLYSGNVSESVIVKNFFYPATYLVILIGGIYMLFGGFPV